MRSILVIYCKGFAMGAVDIVPGVSGATIALIVGIYDRLIAAITAIDPRAFRSTIRLHEADARERLVFELQRMDVVFLLTLGVGILTAVVVFARVIEVAVTTYPVPTYAFFFGLIAASAIVLYGEIDRWTTRRVAVSIVGVLIAASVTGVTATDASHAPPMIFLAGAVAICAMVLPGVSGAFFLLVLGQYEYMASVLNEFVDGIIGLINGESMTPVLDAGGVVAIFMLGAVVGLFSMAHLVKRALDRYRIATLAFLVSLMVGALRLPFEEVSRNLGHTAAGSLQMAILGGIIGCLAVFLVYRYTDDLEYTNDT